MSKIDDNKKSIYTYKRSVKAQRSVLQFDGKKKTEVIVGLGRRAVERP